MEEGFGDAVRTIVVVFFFGSMRRLIEDKANLADVI